MKEVSKIIITLINPKIKINNNILEWINEDILHNLVKNDMFSYHFKEYKIIFNYHEYFLSCPVITNSTPRQTILLAPSMIIPRKKYPVYVYLFGVYRYLSSNLSMRQVADEVKKKFGLETFSHSTLSRTLKKLTQNLESFFTYFPEKIKYVNKKININPHYRLCSNSNDNKALLLHTILSPVRKAHEMFSSQLVYEYFCKSGGQYFL